MIFQILKKRANQGDLIFKREDKVISIPYPEMFNLAEIFSNELIEKGIKRGDSVGIFLDNSPEWVIIDLACHRIGAIVVPINTKLPSEDINHILEDSKTKLLFSKKDFKFTDIFFIKEDFIENLKNIKKIKELKFETNPKDIATISYTSGSSGKPKGVVLTHNNIIYNFENQPVKINHNDLMISYLPLSHMYERTCGYYAAMYNDTTIVLLENPKDIQSYIKEFKPTVLTSVPYVLEKIYKKVVEKKSTQIIGKMGVDFIIRKKLKEKLGGRLRLISCGGAPMDKKIADFFFSMKIPVYQGYGLTELSPLVSTNTPEENKIGSVGKPIKGVKVKISEEGTLLVNSPGLMKRYAHEEKDFNEEWFDTNDLAEIDGDGFIYIKGRKDNLIVLNNGKNIYPEKLEKLLEKEGIDFAVIFGNEHPYIIALLFTYKERPRVDDIIKRVNKNLPDYEKIKKVLLIKDKLRVENKTLTPTLKKIRKNIEKKYIDMIDQIYSHKSL